MHPFVEKLTILFSCMGVLLLIIGTVHISKKIKEKKHNKES
ncbi:hypothetical protein P4U05_24960 [Bacillus paranthracis]|nr:MULTISPECIES: hypothetical protein [Bacillus cereus group]ADY21850.1 hypothetical protein YBT020_13080 [Bacillus thuringiensis serovar finitimus YBT-020]MDA2289050.1 hypothetical protein [Bacillus cereus group sp. Bc191]MEC3360207.1 hypothetical protein [Bacillus paranthracis]MED0786281.1 hypothetical protein [Bacillus paranthracis]MED0810246.1 hypothetical protein [Bacillus paranthracis]